MTHGINMSVRRAHGAIDNDPPTVNRHRQIKVKPLNIGASA